MIQYNTFCQEITLI